MIDPSFLRKPMNYHTRLAGLAPRTWPPTQKDLDELAQQCILLTEEIYAWEGETGGEDLVDINRRLITSSQARRLLALGVSVSYEGDITALMIPGGRRRVAVELRAQVEEEQGILHHTELLLSWEEKGTEQLRDVWLQRQGPQWYMLSQLRDDVYEDRVPAH